MTLTTNSTLTPLKPEGTIDQIFELHCVADDTVRQQHLDSAVARGLPHCIKRAKRPGAVAIVASGPSAAESVDFLKNFDGEIWGINGAFAWLLKRGIKPSAFVGIDPEAILKGYLIEMPDDAVYYLAAQVHPEVFDHLEGKNVKVWFPADSGVKTPRGEPQIYGGSTCLGRAPNLAYLLGWREVHIIGGDSSYTNKSHVYGETGDLPGGTFPFELNGRMFITTRQMLQQACEFSEQMVEWARPGENGAEPLEVYLHGDGLMQEIFRQNSEAGVYEQYLQESMTPGMNRKQRRAFKKMRA
jgi:hypothetical protein